MFGRLSPVQRVVMNERLRQGVLYLNVPETWLKPVAGFMTLRLDIKTRHIPEPYRSMLKKQDLDMDLVISMLRTQYDTEPRLVHDHRLFLAAIILSSNLARKPRRFPYFNC